MAIFTAIVWRNANIYWMSTVYKEMPIFTECL